MPEEGAFLIHFVNFVIYSCIFKYIFKLKAFI